MATRPISFSVGEFYHIYNRGTDKREVFLDDYDRDRFIKLLFVANGVEPFVFREFPPGLSYINFKRGGPIVGVGSYCLMPNHFHLLLKETEENGISRFLAKTLTSYSSYFNKKYKRTGRLFEGTFKATHADTDEYLKYLYAYIHLNPVKLINKNWKENGISDHEYTRRFLESYKYSSYIDFVGKERKEKAILDTKSFPEYFAGVNDFDKFVNEWLSYKDFDSDLISKNT